MKTKTNKTPKDYLLEAANMNPSDVLIAIKVNGTVICNSKTDSGPAEALLMLHVLTEIVHDGVGFKPDKRSEHEN